MEGRIKAVQATLQCFYSVSQLSIKFVCACAHHVMINLGLLRILSILLSLVSLQIPDSNASGGGARGFFCSLAQQTTYKPIYSRVHYALDRSRKVNIIFP